MKDPKDIDPDDAINVLAVVEVTERRTVRWTLSRAEVVEAGYNPDKPMDLLQFVENDRDYDEVADSMVALADASSADTDPPEVIRVEVASSSKNVSPNERRRR